MTQSAAAGTGGVNVLETIRTNLRHRPVWSARELRNAVTAIVEAHGIVHHRIASAVGVNATVISRGLGRYGANRGFTQFDHVAVALGFTPCGDIEGRTYKPSSIDRVAA